MVKSFKSPEYSEFTNNWTTIDLTNDWTRANNHGVESLSAENGAISLSGDRMGYNGGNSYDQITSKFDLSSNRLISFYASTASLCSPPDAGDSVSATLSLTDGTNSLTLLSSSTSGNNSTSGYFGLASASAYFTLEIDGNTVNIKVRSMNYSRATTGYSASNSIVANNYSLDISTWSKLNIRLNVYGDARGGYAAVSGSSQVVLSPIISSKKVIGSKKTLSKPI